MNFQGKKALITGASAGIGAEFARELARRGANLVLVARRDDKLRTLAAEPCMLGRDIRILPADLAEARGLAEIVKYISSEGVDILVNNAGRGSFGCFEDLAVQDELAMIDLNVRATVALAHAAIPRWKAQRSGALIGVSSIAAMQPLPYMATYSATKAFNFNHTVALWAELKRFGIKAVAVCPGPTDTEFAGVARVPGTFSGMHRDSVHTVVRQSLRALEWGLPYVVPGWRSWFMSLGVRICPALLRTLGTEHVMRGILGQAKGG